MLRLIACLVAGLIVPVLVANCETVLSEERTSMSLSRIMLVSETEFSESFLVQISNRILKEESAEFITFAAVTEGRQRFDLAQWSDVPVAIWTRNCSRAANSQGRVALMTKIGRDAVLRIRDRQSIHRLVLSGNDPLQYRISSSTFEIVHLSPTSGASQFVIHVQSQGALNVEDGKELYKQLRERLSSAAIYLVIREDPWFYGLIASCWWSLKAPTEVIVKAGPQITCTSSRPEGAVCKAD